MWQDNNHKLYRSFIFKDFSEAFSFMVRVALIAESMNHHPSWKNEWNKVEIWLSTHDADDLITPKDHDMASAIDKVYASINATGS